MCKCLQSRERNEIYKEKSIGFRGEALQSLCKASRLQIKTKLKHEATGLQVTFTSQGEIATLEVLNELEHEKGTVVSVRDIFFNNISYQKKYRSNICLQFENCINVLTSYSLIMSKVSLHVTNQDVASNNLLNET